MKIQVDPLISPEGSRAMWGMHPTTGRPALKLIGSGVQVVVEFDDLEAVKQLGVDACFVWGLAAQAEHEKKTAAGVPRGASSLLVGIDGAPLGGAP